MLLEKCKMLGMRPRDVMRLPENEDAFLTFAILKRSKDGSNRSD